MSSFNCAPVVPIIHYFCVEGSVEVALLLLYEKDWNSWVANLLRSFNPSE